MQSFDNLFAEKVTALIGSSQEKILYFFKGFDLPQIRYLIHHTNSLLCSDDLLKDSCLNLQALNNSWIAIAEKIRTASGPLVGFYEELISIRPFLSRLAVEKIVVIENNILSPWQPGIIPYEQALALFDYLQAEQDPDTELIQILTEYYGNVKLLVENNFLLLPISMEGIGEIVPYWEEAHVSMGTNSAERIEVESVHDWLYRLNLLRGFCQPALFLQHGYQLTARQRALAGALQALGVDFAFDEIARYTKKVVYDETPFLPLLHRYWGAEASFRMLPFYRAPDYSQETEMISQGQIICEIVQQCVSVVENKPYSNIFITSPTGAGKSILFQIPALYLAEKFNMVTIVVSPLIALMNDQVDQLGRERGVTIAASLNSTISVEERLEIIAQIRTGRKSLIYMAPELLLSTRIHDFLGGRELGLLVIDEAHTVTSWGRDFRSDYWFLSDFIRKARRDGMRFPVLCLTATAVYSGENDVIYDTIQELGLESTLIHLGNVKRDNISFDIVRRNKVKETQSVERTKYDLTLARTRKYIAAGEKVLTYFPYRSQVDEIHNMISLKEKKLIRRYHGQLSPEERQMVEKSYKSGEALGLFCTKAFGMGIDVGDIRHVVHFAPAGSLADYVQEIGRAARDPNIQGIAHIDYFSSDLRYLRTLNNLSEIRQYQLRGMLKKLCTMYESKKRRNLLVSSESFDYLFTADESENKTKLCLLLLAKDLSNHYDFPVLVVRPRPMLSQNYVFVPEAIREQFLSSYGSYAKLESGAYNRKIPVKNVYASDVNVFSDGDVYLMDMESVWENCFPDAPFGIFKRKFFEKTISVKGEKYHIAPRVLTEIHYEEEVNVIAERLNVIINAVVDIFNKYKYSKEKLFTVQMFEDDLQKALGKGMVPRGTAPLLLDIFTKPNNENPAYAKTNTRIRVLIRKKKEDSEERAYSVASTAYAKLTNYFQQRLYQCSPNVDDTTFRQFYPVIRNNPIEIMPLMRVLELFNFATYEVRGGERTEVFVRINDPDKLFKLNTSTYTNDMLRTIRQRHDNDLKLLSSFFTTVMTTEERWDLIEQYFLGNDMYVHQHLHMTT